MKNDNLLPIVNGGFKTGELVLLSANQGTGKSFFEGKIWADEHRKHVYNSACPLCKYQFAE